MDSRDSSSVAAPNRDTSSSPPEDDGSLSVTAALAKDAALLYQSGKFADCLKVLNQLLQKKEGDPKVLHNIAIVDNFHDGCSNPKKLLEVLNNVKKQSEELARASGEHVDAVSDSGSNTVIGTNGNNSIAPIVLNGEFATYVALFNIAVTWFHLHEYSNSFSILEPLYQNIAPINEEIALRICLLLLDVALLSHQAPRSADVINYVEKISCVSTLTCQGDNGSSTQQQSSNLATKSSGPNNIPIPDVSSSDPAANASESPLSRSLLEEAEYENFFSTLDISGQNLPRPSVVDSSNNFPRTQVDDSFPTIDLRLKLHLYKVQFLLLTRNPKAAKCEVKMAMNIARGKDYSMALFLKSQLEYARGNHRKAIKLLMASTNRTEIGISVMYYNNLGCIYYRLGKYQTSTVFFSKALSSSSSIRKEKPLTLSTFSQDKSLLIVYNCGVQYLACGKPVLAARCFHKASLVFYNRPLLWLRIAECCLMALEKGLLESGGAPSTIRSDVRVHVVGRGKWRNLLMEDGVSRNGQMDFVGREDSFWGDDRLPKLAMPLARQCLLNALLLLNSPESTFLKSGLPSNLAQEEETVSPNNTNYKSVSIASRADRFESGGDSQAHNLGVDAGQVSANGELKEQKSGNNLNATLQSSISDYEEICRKENQMIRESVLADLAYVELELGNPLKALSTARTLLKVAKCSRICIFLGNVYAAEALCLLNRSKEAAEHLLIYLSDDNNIELPYTLEDCKKWRVEKTVDVEESNVGSVDATISSVDESQGFVLLNPEEARGTLYANLAAMSAMQGDLEQANRFVIQALSAIPNSPGAILTAIYLDLMWGKPYEAIAKLKQCSRTRFLPGSSRVNGLL